MAGLSITIGFRSEEIAPHPLTLPGQHKCCECESTVLTQFAMDAVIQKGLTKNRRIKDDIGKKCEDCW